ncbi:hypothetical protein VTI28DRAFT_2859 [Corynascus sepedonium]
MSDPHPTGAHLAHPGVPTTQQHCSPPALELTRTLIRQTPASPGRISQGAKQANPVSPKASIRAFVVRLPFFPHHRFTPLAGTRFPRTRKQQKKSTKKNKSARSLWA